jgi:hypothetical protein
MQCVLRTAPSAQDHKVVCIVDEAIAEARDRLAPVEFAAWVDELGLGVREVEGLLAEASTAEMTRREAMIGRPVIPRTIGVALIDRDFDRVAGR